MRTAIIYRRLQPLARRRIPRRRACRPLQFGQRSATVWRASTASEACSASFTTDLKYQQALALTRQRAGTSGREAQMRLSSITAR